MELSGIPMENFPPTVGNDSKTLRKLSLLEARMLGAGNESGDASLPPNDGSRGSENNSNSMSTIGFAKPRAHVGSPGGTGGGSRLKIDTSQDNGGGAKRKASKDGGPSPPRPSAQSQNTGTSSTLSTSPGESRNWSIARPSVQGVEDDISSLKRARTGGVPKPQQPPRLTLPQGEGDRQVVEGSGVGTRPGAAKGTQSHARRRLHGGDGSGSPVSAQQSSGRKGLRLSSDRPAQGLDQPKGSKPNERSLAQTFSDAACGNVPPTPPPPPALNALQGADFSPPSGGRGGRGGGQPAQSGVTKTIQSYFFKPSNGSAVQNLASSYGVGDPLGQLRPASGLPRDVDISGADSESSRSEMGHDPQMARVGRSGLMGVLGGREGDGRTSNQHRFSQAGLPPVEGQGVGQAHQEQRQAQSRGEAAGLGGAAGKDSGQAGNDQANVEKLSTRLREAEALAARLRKELDRANLERSSMESMADTLQKQMDQNIDEFKAKELDRSEQKEKLTSVVETLLRQVSAQEASDCRAKLARDSLELGKIVSVKTGHIGRYVDAFEEGSSFKKVENKTADMLFRKTKLEARKRAVAKLLKSGAVVGGDGDSNGQARLEAVEEEETVRMHLTALKREEVALQEEKRALDSRKVLHIRELKRVAHEDRSKFANRPTLSGRYVLLNLLGKGGFSEVWRAFDLVHAEEVAVKVHQLLNNWTEPQKINFIRHVTREYEIHQQMRHPRIVNLKDVFEICCDSFATVLNYCRGTDLECLLRARKYLPERDARALVLQVARGLLYLNTAQGEGETRRGAIIHYDLKPGNILLDENGDVKITDFGLSKILEIKKDTERGSGEGTSMELTSKGAGTYWYLPPECFGDNPRISSKVDVWSLGVVFYQMLYGVRPFGEGLSQEKILREKVIVNANRVKFPLKPVVSEEARSFIRSCLTYTHATRPDVHAMCNLSYLTTQVTKRAA